MNDKENWKFAQNTFIRFKMECLMNCIKTFAWERIYEHEIIGYNKSQLTNPQLHTIILSKMTKFLIMDDEQSIQK